MARNRFAILLAALALMAAACGSRLTPRQLAVAKGLVGSSQPGSAASQGSQPTGSGSLLGGSGSPGSPTVAGPVLTRGSSPSGGPASPGGHTSVSLGGVGGSPSAARVCSSAPVSGTPGVTNTTITVGNVSTLTGPVPGLVAGAKEGMEAFAAYINSTGGICGRQLKVDAGDDNLDPSQNATATQSIAGSVLAFVGSFSIDDTGGASVLASDNVPDVGEAVSPQRANLANNFSPQPNPLGWNVSPYLYFGQRFGPDVVSHMAFFSEAAAGQAATIQEQAMQAVGYKFVYSETSIQATQTDFSAEVNAMKNDGVKGLVFQAPATITADMAKDMANAGFTIPFANWGAPAYDRQFLASGGPAANGAVLDIPSAMFQGEDARSVPEVGLFDKYYEALYGTPPDLFANYAWTSGMLFVDGLNAGGAPTRAALLSGLKSITTFTAGGILPADNPAGKKPPLCYLVVDIVNGQFVRDPADPPAGFRCDANGTYWYAHG